MESERGDARLAFVWLPMVPGDDRASAAEAAAEFPAQRTAHFWDESRLLGRSWTAHFAARHSDELRQAARDLPELLERVEAWSADPEHAPPAWDCAFFFEAGATWTEPLPEPVAWTKQLGFRHQDDGTSGGTFWCDRSPAALVESSWDAEIATGMRRVVVLDQGTLAQLELLGFGSCPNTRILRANAEAALEASGISAEIVYVDEEALPADDPRRGWPAPTLLLRGRDLFGLPAPTDSTLTCRMYAGGVPSAEAIAVRLRTALADER